MIKNKKVEKIIDNFLSHLILYDENYSNLNGLFVIKFDKLNNKLIKGEIKLIINEKNSYKRSKI